MAVAAVTGFVMWGAVLLDAGVLSSNPLWIALSAAIAVAGLTFVVAGAVAFRRARTTFNPLQPETSSSLVCSGIYSITRNPMYVGFVLVLVAWAVFLSSPFALIGPLAFAVYITWFQIVPEERVLSQKFGADYISYQEKVPRWIGVPTTRRNRRP